jgi:hypothetical protein
MTINFAGGFDQQAKSGILALFEPGELGSVERALGLTEVNDQFRSDLARIVFFYVQSLKRGRGSARPAHANKQLTKIRDAADALRNKIVALTGSEDVLSIDILFRMMAVRGGRDVVGRLDALASELHELRDVAEKALRDIRDTGGRTAASKGFLIWMLSDFCKKFLGRRLVMTKSNYDNGPKFRGPLAALFTVVDRAISIATNTRPMTNTAVGKLIERHAPREDSATEPPR